MKRLIALLLLLSLTVMAGCTPFFALPNDTIKAPRTTGEYEEIQKALILALDEDITMQYPKCKGTSAAFTTGDVDGDGEGEILAFYRPVSVSATHINILKSIDGRWQSVADIEPVGSMLERVELCDLDGDGSVEIITGWSVYDSKNYELAVFSFNEQSVTRRMTEKYTQFMVSDYNGDQNDEIVLLLLNSDAKTSQMLFYKLTANETTVEASCQFNGTVTSYSEIYGVEAEDGMCYFADGFMGNGIVITEGVLYRDNKALNIIDNSSNETPSKTYRTFEAKIKHMDGKLLIPFVRAMNEEGERLPQLTAQHSIIDWCYYNGEEFVTDYVSYYCLDGSYEIMFEEEWENRLSCSYNTETKELIFYDIKDMMNEAFKITEVALLEETNDVDDPEKYVDSVRIKTGDISAYFLTVSDENTLNITTETIRRNFIYREN
ncbi:MAG: hypothetical protein IJ462_02465 [Clostridia bacterium]|nr:hypothetical protein [Clostridia bacterium]